MYADVALLIISWSVLNCKYPSLSMISFFVLLICSLYNLRTAELFAVAIAGIVDKARRRLNNAQLYCNDRLINNRKEEARDIVSIIDNIDRR